MRTPNHLAGGLVITGFCSALCGVNIFASPLSIGILAIASLLPDIDHPKSIIGRSLKPIALAINRRWGHRTITHSGVCPNRIHLPLRRHRKDRRRHQFPGHHLLLRLLSHLLLDMVTFMGVPLLYPFSKNPFVMPANPHWRIRNDDRRAETIAFCLFLLAALFMRPLFEQGFWTTYNRTFGTLKHVVSEFHKAEDLLEVAYTGKVGTEPISGKGYCIEVTEQYAVLLENGRFRRLDKSSMVLSHLLPRHTGRKFVYEHLSIVNITIDSLNHLVQNQLIAEIDISSTQPFFTLHQGHTTEQKRFHDKYLTNLAFLTPNHEASFSPRGEMSKTEGALLPPLGGLRGAYFPPPGGPRGASTPASPSSKTNSSNSNARTNNSTTNSAPEKETSNTSNNKSDKPQTCPPKNTSTNN
jgi:inner membrane protein